MGRCIYCCAKTEKQICDECEQVFGSEKEEYFYDK